MLCIYQHMRAVIESLFRNMRKQLLHYNELHKGKIHDLANADATRRYNIQVDCYIQSAVSRGLDYFLRFLSLPKNNQDARLGVVIENMCGWQSNDLLISASRRAARRRWHPSRNDLRERERETLLFLGDSVATTPRPPFSWCLMWNGTYSDRYGAAVPKDLRKWGYIFWDREREWLVAERESCCCIPGEVAMRKTPEQPRCKGETISIICNLADQSKDS